ncbi:UbiA family prenyltransferase [Streptomyces hygroscopicus]|uniref:UbiA family prenyltransferase n=1 Tax=Streptomyces hygroscopicus TaxID=1912 RepID=UPI001FCFA54B|nr:UbiA family prenyltransferase [Streptomyces hygroscopicus]
MPGDALAGAAAVGRRPNRGTALAVCASLCLYEAGMALNDWADRDIDAIERPGRPLPSGRIAPAAALAAATGLTAAGLACAAAAGRPALATATALAGTVWAYDLGLKNTLAGPPTMAATRALDLLLGAAATAPRPAAVGSAGGAPRLAAVRTTPAALRPAAVASAPVTPRPAGVRSALRPALRPAVLLGAHTLAVTAVSRREAVGGSSAAPLAALAVGTAIAWTATRRPSRPANPAARRPFPRAGDGGAVNRPAVVAAAPGATARERGPAAGAAVGRGLVRVLSRGARPWRGGPPRRLAGAALAGVATGAERHAAATARTGRGGPPAGWPARRPVPGPARRPAPDVGAGHRTRPVSRVAAVAGAVLAGGYAATIARPLAHAALNPSPYLLQRAVGSGIRAVIPLQAVLASRAGAHRTAAGLLALMPVARRLSRKVSAT